MTKETIKNTELYAEDGELLPVTCPTCKRENLRGETCSYCGQMLLKTRQQRAEDLRIEAEQKAELERQQKDEQARSEALQQQKAQWKQAYDAKLVTLVKKNVCPVCFEHVSPKSQFCTNCGQDLSVLHEHKGVTIDQHDELLSDKKLTQHCPFCWAETKPTEKFCNSCGADLRTYWDHKLISITMFDILRDDPYLKYQTALNKFASLSECTVSNRDEETAKGALVPQHTEAIYEVSANTSTSIASDGFDEVTRAINRNTNTNIVLAIFEGIFHIIGGIFRFFIDLLFIGMRSM